MKVVKHIHGYSIRLTDNEFGILKTAFNTTHISLLWSILTSKERRSYSRRCGIASSRRTGPTGGSDFLRVDHDRRGDL